MTRQKQRSILLRLAVLLLCAVMCVLVLFAKTAFSVGAANGTSDKLYTDVIMDLSKDKSFDIVNYPERDDYSIDVIQLAESEDNELFLYCYITSSSAAGKDGKTVKLLPTQVSLAVSTDINALQYELHDLKLLNSYNTLFKFLVIGVDVDVSSTVRYYSVSMLQRRMADGKEKAEDISKLWTVETIAPGKIFYKERHKDTIEILNPLAGAVRYKKDQVPANWGVDAVDSHFIAFDTDLPIDDLLEADVSYISMAWLSNEKGGYGGPSIIDKEYLNAYSKFLGSNSSISVLMAYLVQDKLHGINDPGPYELPKDCSYENFTAFVYDYVRAKNPKFVTIKKDEKYTFETGGWWFRDTYEWNRIQDIKGFKASLQGKNIVNMSGNYTVADIEKRTWFLRYRETTWDDPDNSMEEFFDSEQYKSTRDLDIVVLRLKFETDGVVYDMGTVSNKVDQTEYISGNESKSFWDYLIEWFEDNWPWLLAVVIGVVLLIVLAPFLPTILSGLVALLRLLIKGLWWLLKHIAIGLWGLIKLPFRAIAALVRKIKEKKETASS